VTPTADDVTFRNLVSNLRNRPFTMASLGNTDDLTSSDVVEIHEKRLKPFATILARDGLQTIDESMITLPSGSILALFGPNRYSGRSMDSVAPDAQQTALRYFR
jgi:hypothetical protein